MQKEHCAVGARFQIWLVKLSSPDVAGRAPLALKTLRLKWGVVEIGCTHQCSEQGENRSWVSASVGLSQLPVPTGFLRLPLPRFGLHTHLFRNSRTWNGALGLALRRSTSLPAFCLGVLACLCRSNSYSVPFQRLLLCPTLILAVPAGQEGPFTPRVLRFCSVASQRGLVMTAVSSLTWATMNFCAGGRRGLGS